MSDGGTVAGAAVRLWARSELARRWRTLVALGLIAGVAAGLALAAVMGARRTASAYARYRTATAAPDALVFGTQVGIHDADYTPVLRLPEVVDGGVFVLTPVALREHAIGGLAPGDDRLYRTISRPLLADGRLPDPRRSDEVVINRKAASRYHFHVGQRVTIDSSMEMDAFYTGAPPVGGPSQRATIVGIGDSLIDLIFQPDEPGATPSVGFLTQHPEVPRAPN